MIIFRIVYVSFFLLFNFLFLYFNTKNTSSISLIIKDFANVPIFIVSGVSFILGILFCIMLSVDISLSKKLKNKLKEQKEQIKKFEKEKGDKKEVEK